MTAATNVTVASSGTTKWLHVAFWKKPLHLLSHEHAPSHSQPHLPHRASLEHTSSAASDTTDSPATPLAEMPRTLGLFDLIMIGIGGTVGSGVFATAGLIARVYAGPAAVLSWLMAGAGCVLSGFSFMELAGRIPSTGSTYAYAYHALGELPALVAGFLLTLEYGVSSAGGARAWSDKFVHWLATELNVHGPEWMKPPDSTVDLYAGLLMALCVGIVLCGLQAGKTLVNVVTLMKISVVLFIIVVGMSQFDRAHLVPFVPPAVVDASTGERAFGWSGVFLGASASFFGYIGYDEVCCLAGEATNPTVTIPRAVIGTIVGAAALSTFATLALVGMQSYREIDPRESFGAAFAAAGFPRAATLVTTGEVLTMPITTFIGFLAQPRVLFAMASDGLLPHVFARVDPASGTLFYGTLLCGIALITIAVFVPFHVLWSFISLGILVAFNLTNASLLLIRGNEATHTGNTDSTTPKTGWLTPPPLIAAFTLTSLLAAIHWQHSVIAFVPLADATGSSLVDTYMAAVGAPLAVVFTVGAIVLMCLLQYVDVAARRRSHTAATTAPTDKTTTKKKRLSGADAGDSVALTDNVVALQPLANESSSSHTSEQGERQLRVRVKSDDSDAEGLSLLPSTHKSAGCSSAATLSTTAQTDVDCTVISAADALHETEAAAVPLRATFRAPFVPFAPCVAIFFNWFLFVQMDATSVLLILLWLLFAVAVYVGYSRHHSLARQHTSTYHRVDAQ